MAQGSRKRIAVLGASMLLCTGLVGCMDNDPKPLKGPSKTPSCGVMGSTVKPGLGSTNGSGAQPAGFNSTGGRPPANGDYFKTGSTGGNTNFGAQTVPGSTGMGTSMAPSGSGVVPGIAPSNYPPASGGTPTSSLPANPPTFDYGNVTMPSPPQPPLNAGYPAAPTRQ